MNGILFYLGVILIGIAAYLDPISAYFDPKVFFYGMGIGMMLVALVYRTSKLRIFRKKNEQENI